MMSAPSPPFPIQIPEPVLIVAAVLGISWLLMRLGAWLRGDAFPYVSAGALVSKGELRFFLVLQQALPPGLHICPKVRLADLVQVKKGIGSREWGRAFNQVKSKHLDFVLCDSSTLAIRLAIELDDRSHALAANAERDRKKDGALASAGIPLLRIPARTSGAYSVPELRAAIAEALRTRS